MVFRRRPRARRGAADPLAEQVDPAAVPAPYRPALEDAARARSQFGALVAATAPGPLQDRLLELGAGVDAGVLAVWHATQQAVRLESVVAALDPDRVTEELKRIKRAEQAGQADPATVEAMSARFASVQGLLNSLDELRRQIPVLEARLGTAVARAAEITLTSNMSASAAAVDGLRSDLEQLVADLDALRSAAEVAR